MTKEEKKAGKKQREAEERAKRRADSRAYIDELVKSDRKVSKSAEWLRQHPDGIGKILDMRAVMK